MYYRVSWCACRGKGYRITSREWIVAIVKLGRLC